jgi:hypothetical protein
MGYLGTNSEMECKRIYRKEERGRIMRRWWRRREIEEENKNMNKKKTGGISTAS